MRKKLILAAYCALLCITVTFSWLFDIVPNHVKEVVIDYKDRGHLFIANANMRGSLFMQDPSGTYVEVDESFSFDSNRLIPNAVIPFNIDIQNTGSSNISFMMFSSVPSSNCETSTNFSRGWKVCPFALRLWVSM